MSYLVKQGRRTRGRRPPLSGGGVYDELVKAVNKIGGEPACLSEANTKVAALDAQIDDVNVNWRPTGFYTRAQVQQIVSSTLTMASQASTIVGGAPRSTGDAEFSINQALDTIRQQTVGALLYTKAVADATRQGIDVIDSPGLKAWVVRTMRAASDALVTAAVLECNMSWLANAIIAYTRAFQVLANVVKAIVGIIIKAGETALKVADAGLGLAQDLAHVIKKAGPIIVVGGLATGAYFLFKMIKARTG